MTSKTSTAARPSTPNTEPTESLLSRTILSPILFLSFIFSLLIVDRRTSSSILSPRGSPLGSPRSGGSEGKGGHTAYYHSHQRKLARKEIDEAFAIRGRVMVWMFVLAGAGFVGMGWMAVKVWGWVKNG